MGSHWHDPPWAVGDRDGLGMAGPWQSPMAPSGVPVSKPVGYAAAMAQHLKHSKLMSRSDDPRDTTNANGGSGEAATAATQPFKRKAH